MRFADFFGGRFDLLVNNAGGGFAGLFTAPPTPLPQALEKVVKVQSNEDWERAFALNFYGALYGCRAAIPLMQRQGGGQIVNVISGIAFTPMPYQTMYSATKSALNGLTLSLRSEYWDDGIKFNSATPGTTATAIWGDMDVPATAQTPQQSARRILSGVARNMRIICGDDPDVSGSKNCFNPDAAPYIDEYLLNVARERRKGHMLV